MHTMLQKLLSNVPVITDGAWGTHLREYGLKPGECPDAWNIINPQKVESLVRSYINAGSKIILTNTFRANRLSLGTYGLDDQVIKINTAGVEIACRAAKGNAVVFGSMGYTGKLLSERVIEENNLFQTFTEQAQALAGAGVKGIVIESMIDIVEAKIALKAAKDTGLPVVVSMVFDSGREKDMTIMGDSPEQVAIELSSAGADIVGASFIGGCCGTNPEYIRLISKITNKK